MLLPRLLLLRIQETRKSHQVELMLHPRLLLLRRSVVIKIIQVQDLKKKRNY
jgi:hypothetical protein